MKYVDEFRNKILVEKIASGIKALNIDAKVNLMEVCGTHTQSFARFGLNKFLPENIRLIPGPGCPVCVSSPQYIDRAISLAKDKNNIIVTFGDMLRVPGSVSSLEKERMRFGNVIAVYSPLDALRIAKADSAKKIFFLAVGFETTAPTIAITAMLAKKEKINNIFFLSSLKLMPPAMRFLLKDKRLNIDGFLCPGHVSSIIGLKPYEFIPRKHKIGCCVAGFEPTDILEGILMLCRQIADNKPRVDNQYSRVVKNNGNPKARKIIHNVFETCDAQWRGLGVITNSGLKLRKKYSGLDAESIMHFERRTVFHPEEFAKGCKCGQVLKGLIMPKDCPLFYVKCKPDSPIGPCMVSSEGACNAYFRYKRQK
ncbi:MAG: hydrogenase formation protein HypD [Candidatus Omnitrophota bacterium]|jgi:hydrogenase expression/formation protein HypD|nr:MAG: hydrogenase formation protein HypD [Candidatus Omnitrophota bacterium]